MIIRGGAVNGLYSNWRTVGPNNSADGIPEHYGQIYGQGAPVSVVIDGVTVLTQSYWNDLPNDSIHNCNAYVIEYGAPGADASTLVLTGTKTVAIGGVNGTITIVKSTAPATAGDGTFTYASADADFDGLSLTTSGNRAQSQAFDKAVGSYTITENTVTGWKLTAISCSGDIDKGSVIDVSARQVTIDLDADEAITCTFTSSRDEAFVVARTRRARAQSEKWEPVFG